MHFALNFTPFIFPIVFLFLLVSILLLRFCFSPTELGEDGIMPFGTGGAEVFISFWAPVLLFGSMDEKQGVGDKVTYTPLASLRPFSWQNGELMDLECL